MQASLAADLTSVIERMSLAILQRQAGDWLAAAGTLGEVVAAYPDMLPARLERAQAFGAARAWMPALHDLLYVRQRSPGFPGVEQLLEEIDARAQADWQRRMATRPHPETQLERARFLLELGRYEEALACAQTSMQTGPSSAEKWMVLGDVLFRAGQLDECIGTYKRAIRAHPESATLWFNLGNALQRGAQIESALNCYQHLITMAPQCAEARVEIAHCYHFMGQPQQAWPYYEWRWRTAQMCADRLPSARPAWLGALPAQSPVWEHVLTGSLRDQTLLLWAEQGAGDIIQFLRYLPHVSALAGRVCLRVPPKLVRLARACLSQVDVVSTSEPLPEHDCHCPLMSLPGALASGALQGIDPYVQIARRDAAHGARPRIGLVWAGRQHGTPNPGRDLPWQEVLPLLEVDADWISLQTPVPLAERHAVATEARMLQPLEHEADYLDTAHWLASLDALVSVDTSVAHLAGAMGLPCHLLLRASSEWRWGWQTDRSHWYHAHRLHRQRVQGNWYEPVQNVIASLHLSFSRTQLSSD